MSAGSGASNLGYSNITPNSNINDNFINKDSSNWAGSFGSNEVPGICMKGGSKHLKRKIKNISRRYKRMRAGSRRIRSMRNRLRSRALARSASLAASASGGRRSRRHSSRRRHSRSRRQRGGYSQYQNNMPMTPSYQVAGINLPASQSALANPVPITRLSNCVNCVDNYNHYTNSGFPSKGH